MVVILLLIALPSRCPSPCVTYFFFLPFCSHVVSNIPTSYFFLQIWDFSSHVNVLAESETELSREASDVFTQAPLVKFGGHKDEGYAIDWSPLVPGRLVSGNGS